MKEILSISCTDYAELPELPDEYKSKEEIFLAFLKKVENGFSNSVKEGRYKNLENSISCRPPKRPKGKKSENKLHLVRINEGKNDRDLKEIDTIYTVGGWDKIWMQGIIGTIHDPKFEYEGKEYDITLKIRSRFDLDEKKSYFMAEMIRRYVENEFDLKLTEDEIPVEDEKIFTFLKICIFRNRLLQAYEAGFYKKYTYFKCNDMRVRGRIDVSRHIRLNMGLNNGKIAYEYRENTTDNAVNHLILRTWMELKRSYAGMADVILSREDESGVSAEKILKQLQYLAPGYQDKSLQSILREADISVTSIYYSEYESLRKSCIDILKGLELSIFANVEEVDESVESMLFYVPGLWEICAGQILKQICPKNENEGYKLEPQKEIDVLHRSDEDKIGKRYPDFVISKGKEVKLVLDAKFKPAWKRNIDYDKVKDDIRQVLAYGELEQAEKIGVIFPTSARKNEGTFADEWKIGNRTDRVRFCVCGLEIPEIKSNEKSQSFKEWKSELDENMEKLKGELSKIVLGNQ